MDHRPSYENLLQRQWTCFLETTSGKCVVLHTFNTIEMFWRMYNNIPAPSKLPDYSKYRIFQSNVSDHCGRWVIPSPRNRLDKRYLQLTLCIIGETLADPDDSDFITGIEVALRNREDTIKIWTTIKKSKQIREFHLKLMKKVKSLFPLTNPVYIVDDLLNYCFATSFETPRITKKRQVNTTPKSENKTRGFNKREVAAKREVTPTLTIVAQLNC